MTPGYLALCWCLQQEEYTCETVCCSPASKHVEHDHICYLWKWLWSRRDSTETAPAKVFSGHLNPEKSRFFFSVILGFSADLNTWQWSSWKKTVWSWRPVAILSNSSAVFSCLNVFFNWFKCILFSLFYSFCCSSFALYVKPSKLLTLSCAGQRTLPALPADEPLKRSLSSAAPRRMSINWKIIIAWQSKSWFSKVASPEFSTEMASTQHINITTCTLSGGSWISLN